MSIHGNLIGCYPHRTFGLEDFSEYCWEIQCIQYRVLTGLSRQNYMTMIGLILSDLTGWFIWDEFKAIRILKVWCFLKQHWISLLTSQDREEISLWFGRNKTQQHATMSKTLSKKRNLAFQFFTHLSEYYDMGNDPCYLCCLTQCVRKGVRRGGCEDGEKWLKESCAVGIQSLMSALIHQLQCNYSEWHEQRFFYFTSWTVSMEVKVVEKFQLLYFFWLSFNFLFFLEFL